MNRVGIERATPVRRLVQKHAGGMFLARGRFHLCPDVAGKAIDGHKSFYGGNSMIERFPTGHLINVCLLM